MDIELLDTIVSEDLATKYVVRYKDGLVGEVTYIAYPNKDIVCVPTQTACRMGCKFCHLTTAEKPLALRNLTTWEMVDLVQIAINGKYPRRPLLVSFMGAGEILNNWVNTLEAMWKLTTIHGREGVRFAFATMIPKGQARQFLYLADDIRAEGLNVKAHLSVHFTTDAQRKQYMPSALEIKPSLALLESYRTLTGNNVEIHYALMDGVNDSDTDYLNLLSLVRPRDLPVKILHYSDNPALATTVSPLVRAWVTCLRQAGIQAEYYKPNGLDIGASCGQFQLDRYVEAK